MNHLIIKSKLKENLTTESSILRMNHLIIKSKLKENLTTESSILRMNHLIIKSELKENLTTESSILRTNHLIIKSELKENLTQGNPLVYYMDPNTVCTDLTDNPLSLFTGRYDQIRKKISERKRWPNMNRKKPNSPTLKTRVRGASGRRLKQKTACERRWKRWPDMKSKCLPALSLQGKGLMKLSVRQWRSRPWSKQAHTHTQSTYTHTNTHTNTFSFPFSPPPPPLSLTHTNTHFLSLSFPLPPFSQTHTFSFSLPPSPASPPSPPPPHTHTHKHLLPFTQRHIHTHTKDSTLSRVGKWQGKRWSNISECSSA